MLTVQQGPTAGESKGIAYAANTVQLSGEMEVWKKRTGAGYRQEELVMSCRNSKVQPSQKDVQQWQAS